ncbi:MAG TPA: hypothetical protein DDZ04_03405 [Parabacteroides sp.]|nr:hypothetical protein [Parabacteroides sp.]
MKFITPNVEWWPQDTIAQHIARVGRICYKSEGKQPPEDLTEEEVKAFVQKRDEERSKGFWDSGHRSMYRHGTCYFFVPNEKMLHTVYAWSLMVASPYIAYAVQGAKVWISANMQFLCEQAQLMQMLESYGVSEEDYIKKALKCKCKDALALLRMTFVVTTQISTSRELNRTSPNAIAEQSTRYCNLEKKGGVQICEPRWYAGGTRWQRFLYRTACSIGSWIYNRLLKSGLKPQDARGILPLDTYTVVAYTYSIKEWQHIIELRYKETTGKAHPNAKYVVGDIRDTINRRMKVYIPDFEI